MEESSYLTREGAEKLRKELVELKGPAREALSKRLRSAIQQGDLSENADYHAAKEEQGFLEGRIQELERILKNVTIIDDTKRDNSVVVVGNHVTVEEEGIGEDTFFIVGPKEADPMNGRISFESPIGKALMEKKVGETVSITTPNGTIKMKIVSIK
jgi:transcription elongation factor GreA